MLKGLTGVSGLTDYCDSLLEPLISFAGDFLAVLLKSLDLTPLPCLRAEPEARNAVTSSPLASAYTIASHLLATSSTLGQ